MTGLPRALGLLGLVPFIALALVLLLGVGPKAYWLNALNIYALGIGSFMLGSWWRLSASGSTQLLLSNTLYLLLFFSLIIIPRYFLLVAAVVFVLTYYFEQHTELISIESEQYRSFRRLLTLVVVTSLLVGFCGAKLN